MHPEVVWCSMLWNTFQTYSCIVSKGKGRRSAGEELRGSSSSNACCWKNREAPSVLPLPEVLWSSVRWGLTYDLGLIKQAVFFDFVPSGEQARSLCPQFEGGDAVLSTNSSHRCAFQSRMRCHSLILPYTISLSLTSSVFLRLHLRK